MPHTTRVGRTYDSGEFEALHERAFEIADVAGFEARLRASAREGKLRGLGHALYIEACSGGNEERARLTLGEDGVLTIRIGTQSNGQGHHTAYAQLASEALGIDPDKVRVIQGDTDEIAYGAGTGGSRSIPVGGTAVKTGGDRLAEFIRKLAAEKLEAAVADIELFENGARIAGTDREVSFGEIAAAAPEPLDLTESRMPEAPTFPNGMHVVEVEIDPDTGVTEVVKYTVLDDFGVTLNPLMLEGQIHGGIAQGLGQALMERTVYDEGGQLLTASLTDYCLPRAGTCRGSISPPATCRARPTRSVSRAPARPGRSGRARRSSTRWSMRCTGPTASPTSTCRRRRRRCGARSVPPAREKDRPRPEPARPSAPWRDTRRWGACRWPRRCGSTC